MPINYGMRRLRSAPRKQILTTTGKLVNDGETLLYRTKARDCRGCLLKAQCCPKTSVRKIPRSVYEEARDPGAGQDGGVQEIIPRQETCRNAVCAQRILRLGRLRLRGPCGAQFEFTLAAIAQNLRRLAKLGRPATTVRPFALRKRCKGQ